MFEQVSSHDRGRDDHTMEKLSNPNGECVRARVCLTKMPVVCMMSQQTKTVRDKVCETVRSESSPPPACLAHCKPEVAEIRQ